MLILPLQHGYHRYDLKRIGGGLLVQTPDTKNISVSNLNIVTQLKPTPQQLDDLLFAWRVAKFVKSNTIVFCKNGQTLGIGAGQMSRVDSARIASIAPLGRRCPTAESTTVLLMMVWPFSMA